MYKRHTLYCNVVTKGLNIATSIVNIDKRCTLYYNLIHREGKHSFGGIVHSVSSVSKNTRASSLVLVPIIIIIIIINIQDIN